MKARTSPVPALLSSALTWCSMCLRFNASEHLTLPFKLTIACLVARQALSLVNRFVQAPKYRSLIQATRRSLSLLERATLILLVSR